jgi:hypothetical protein
VLGRRLIIGGFPQDRRKLVLERLVTAVAQARIAPKQFLRFEIGARFRAPIFLLLA